MNTWDTETARCDAPQDGADPKRRQSASAMSEGDTGAVQPKERKVRTPEMEENPLPAMERHRCRKEKAGAEEDEVVLLKVHLKAGIKNRRVGMSW